MKLEIIKRWIKESIDIPEYERMFTLQLFMSGDRDAVMAAMENRVLRRQYDAQGSEELPLFADISPGIGQVGLQNHGLVNGRINIQGLTLDPELTFAHDNPFVREYNQAFILERAQRQAWQDHWYQCGMELEANGIAGAMAGLTDGRVDWRHTPNLDSLWDRSKRSPAHWSWTCDRNRLTPEEAIETYGDALTSQQEKEIDADEAPRWTLGGTRDDCPPMRQVIEWSWYSKDYHVVFLRSIFGPDSIALIWDDAKGKYMQAGTDCGPNPFGCIPKWFWIDSWAPSVKRPMGKLQTTIGPASLLNEVEEYMREILHEGVTRTAIDTSKLDDPELLKQLQDKDLSFKKIKKILLVNGGTISDLLSRTTPLEIPEVCLALRAILKEEINASTGVQDMQRGQALGGERRTREEVVRLMDAGGVQARHLRNSFANFLEGVVHVTRAIAVQFDTAETTLHLESYGAVKTSEVPVSKMLSIDLPVQVNPNSLAFKTEEERRQEAANEFLALHQPYIAYGVMDPLKSFVTTFKKYGYQNPVAELGRDPSAAPAGMPQGMPPQAGPPQGGPQGMPPGMPGPGQP